jgi:glycosyltransferase involved in cell wall biosynthesis
MRVAIVNPVWDPRTSTAAGTLDRFRSLTGWADAIRAAGVADVDVFQRFDRPASIERERVSYRFVADGRQPRPADWYGGTALSAAVGAVAPDVVHVNGLGYPRLIRRLRRRLPPSAAVIVQDHGGFDPMTLPTWRKAWMRRGLQSADALLVATKELRDVFIASGLAPATLQVLDVMEASTSLRADRDVARPEGLTLLFVGRLNTNKDPLTVLEGFTRFLARRPDSRIVFVYDNNELESAIKSKLSADAALASKVTLLGHVPHEELSSIYWRADLFVLGSRREGSGYAALEAMACGVIPVLTDIPSFRGMTDGGRLGALWQPGDSASLVDALVRVTSSELQPQRDAVQAHFERCLSWPAIGRRAVEIYRELSRT